MPDAIDIQAALAALPILDGRRPDTSEEEANQAFAVLGALGEARLFTGRFRGESPWERHSRGDELVHVLEGATRLTIVTDDGPQALEMKAGMLTVVPRGCWHKFDAPDGVTLLTATPQPTDHSTVEDPADLPEG